MNLYLIGAGKMATALAGGIVRKRLFKTTELCACDINEIARDAFLKNTGIICEAKPSSKLSQADIILLAVKPQVAEQAVNALPALNPNALIISICAGLRLDKLSQWFGTGNIIRVMPNTPLMVGQGASCYALGPDVSESSGNLAATILNSLGLAFKVDETQLDAVTALSGSGPAYFFEMVAALTEAGKKVGLSHELSLALSIQTLVGSGTMLTAQMGTPDELRDAVTSPHGTTAAGLDVMKQADFRTIMENVVIAARDRSIELGN